MQPQAENVMTVLAQAQKLIHRAAEKGSRGKIITREQMKELAGDLGLEVPSWLTELVTTVPLCGLELGWKAYDPAPGFDGVMWMEWSDADNIRSDSLECYPGLAILKHGYINVASCSQGSGDPYFICVKQGDDPPLYQVYHDIGDKSKVILAKGRRQVASTLSQFFCDALLPAD